MKQGCLLNDTMKITTKSKCLGRLLRLLVLSAGNSIYYLLLRGEIKRKGFGTRKNGRVQGLFLGIECCQKYKKQNSLRFSSSMRMEKAWSPYWLPRGRQKVAQEVKRVRVIKLGFETQVSRYHKSKTGVSVAP